MPEVFLSLHCRVQLLLYLNNHHQRLCIDFSETVYGLYVFYFNSCKINMKEVRACGWQSIFLFRYKQAFPFCSGVNASLLFKLPTPTPKAYVSDSLYCHLVVTSYLQLGYGTYSGLLSSLC